MLAVRELEVRYRVAGAGEVTAVGGVSLEVAEGEVVGVLGESGCGKTSLALAIPGLLPPAGRLAGGEVRFFGERLDRLPERRLERIRGAGIGLVFQEPALALHPTRRVGIQVAEVLRAHRRWRRRRCREVASALMGEVGLGGDGFFDAYPHQLSGGQRQRVVIAQAVACRPALLIADEPTVSLDATTEVRIAELLLGLRERHGMGILFISHDPLLLGRLADRAVVMEGGRVVEEGPCGELLADPQHPTTRALLDALPPLPA